MHICTCKMLSFVFQLTQKQRNIGLLVWIIFIELNQADQAKRLQIIQCVYYTPKFMHIFYECLLISIKYVPQTFLKLTCTSQESSESSLALDHGRQTLRKKPLLKQLRNHEKGNTACVEKLSSTQLAKKTLILTTTKNQW